MIYFNHLADEGERDNDRGHSNDGDDINDARMRHSFYSNDCDSYERENSWWYVPDYDSGCEGSQYSSCLVDTDLESDDGDASDLESNTELESEDEDWDHTDSDTDDDWDHTDSDTDDD